jgi:hypothetical protein
MRFYFLRETQHVAVVHPPTLKAGNGRSLHGLPFAAPALRLVSQAPQVLQAERLIPTLPVSI